MKIDKYKSLWISGTILIVAVGLFTDFQILASVNYKVPADHISQLNLIQVQRKNIMQLTSSDFQNNGPIPQKFSCEGQGINPELNISGVPAAAKSLAFILHDPDAPIAGGFTHWVLFDIAPTTTKIAENSVPAGAKQGKNGTGKNVYIGMCPPSGTHHYHFMLYALDKSLDLKAASTTKDSLLQAIQGHVVAETELIGTYQKTGK